MTGDEMPEDERDDMLSILRELRPFYFWILIAQVAIWGILVFFSERGNCADAGYSGCAVTMGLKMSGLVPLWLVTSVVLVDVGRYFMVLLRSSRERVMARAIAKAKAEAGAKARAEGMAEGKAEGANMMYAQWSEWNARRVEADRRGEPFDEPPPTPNGNAV
jgi:hypothetical protein